MIDGIGYPGPGMGKTQICCRVKPANGIPL